MRCDRASRTPGKSAQQRQRRSPETPFPSGRSCCCSAHQKVPITRLQGPCSVQPGLARRQAEAAEGRAGRGSAAIQGSGATRRLRHNVMRAPRAATPARRRTQWRRVSYPARCKRRPPPPPAEAGTRVRRAHAPHASRCCQPGSSGSLTAQLGGAHLDFASLVL